MAYDETDNFKYLRNVDDTLNEIVNLQIKVERKKISQASAFLCMKNYVDGYITMHPDVMDWEKSNNKELFHNWVKYQASLKYFMLGKNKNLNSTSDSSRSVSSGGTISPLFDIDNINNNALLETSISDIHKECIVTDESESLFYACVGINNVEEVVTNEGHITLHEKKEAKATNANSEKWIKSDIKKGEASKNKRKRKGVPVSINAGNITDAVSAMTVVSVTDHSTQSRSNVGRQYVEVEKFRLLNDTDDLDEAVKIFNEHFKCKNNPSKTLTRNATAGRCRKYANKRTARVYKCQCQLEDKTMNEDDIIHFQFSNQRNDNIGLYNVHVIRVSVHGDKRERALEHFHEIEERTSIPIPGKNMKQMVK